jgi:ATP-dependent RNA helicase SUPV3L1/SUV3
MLALLLLRRCGQPPRAAPLGCRVVSSSARRAPRSSGLHPAAASETERVVADLCDLRSPHLWYPRARRLRRTVHLHVGPTNSGKSHAAIEALKGAAAAGHAGVYCGPLRLLAWEVFERLNAEGTPCSLVTGQEVEEVAGARVVSSTVEMADLDSRNVACVVLDEIQMLGDPDRGWAWSRVLLGSAAPTLHACGDASAVPLVTALLRLTGDELVLHHYSRLSPLTVATRPLASLSGVQRGDCLVAFSRRELFKLKRETEAATGLRCGVVYGALPPQVRREQAQRFNMDAGSRAAHAGGGGGGGGVGGSE